MGDIEKLYTNYACRDELVVGAKLLTVLLIGCLCPCVAGKFLHVAINATFVGYTGSTTCPGRYSGWESFRNDKN